MKSFCASLALATLAIFSVASAHAQTPAFVTSGTANSTGGTGLVGFEFTLNQDIDLTQLGFFAESLGGGDTPHVALLDVTSGQSNPPDVLYDTGNISSDCTVAYPISVTSTGSLTFNYVSVGTPIELFTGHTYEITAPIYWTQDFGNSGGSGDISGFTLGSVFQTASFMIGPGWSNWDLTNGVPTENYDYTAQTAEGTYTTGNTPSGTAHMSANFLYTTIAVPEPQTWAMFFGGVASFCFFRRTFRRK